MPADFWKAFKLTNGTEGGIANNPTDAGQLTYMGIARKFWSLWPGWRIIDAEIGKMIPQPKYGTHEYREWIAALDAILEGIPTLQQSVMAFYRVSFWDANRLGDINDQAVADWAYDHIVNAGARGAMWLQLAAGCTPDGDIGSKTINAVNAADPAELLRRCEDIAGAYRLDRAAEHPSQIQFLTSWLIRDGQPLEIIAMVKQAAADGILDAGEVITLKAAMTVV